MTSSFRQTGRRRASIVALFALVLLTASHSIAAQAESADWSQWRGPGGNGSASCSKLPDDLALDSKNLRWKVEVPGVGHSSPIVVGDKVFVTTAYPGSLGSLTRNSVHLGLGLLGLLAAIAGCLAAERRSALATQAENATGLRRMVTTLDVLAIGVCSILVLGMLPVARVFPDLLWPPGQPGHIWFWTGAIGLAGLTGAAGWFRPASAMRLVFALVLAGAACALWYWIPLTKYTEPFRVTHRAAMVAPGIAGVCWHTLVFILARRSGASGNSLGPTLRSNTTGLCLTTAVVLLFTAENFLQPGVGLVRGVVCYDFNTGQRLWITGVMEAPEERKYELNSFATPTPCVADGRLFCYFGHGYACLDLDGNILWSGEDATYAPKSRYGTSSSPVPFDGSFIVLQDSEQMKRDSFVVAFDQKTGDVLWRVEPKDAHDSYTTPLIVPRGDAAELITVTFDLLVSYDPTSGERLWSMPVKIQQMVPSLTYAGDDLLMIAGGTHLKFSSQGVQLKGVGKATQPESLWTTTRMVPGISSPVLCGGLFFSVTDLGIMTCLDPNTGERHWRKRLGATHRASLVAGPDKVYAINEDGRVTVVAAKKAFTEIATAELGEACSATPALAHDRIVIRGDQNLFCFGAADGN